MLTARSDGQRWNNLWKRWSTVAQCLESQTLNRDESCAVMWNFGQVWFLCVSPVHSAVWMSTWL